MLLVNQEQQAEQRRRGIIDFIFRSYAGGELYTFPLVIYDPYDGSVTDTYLVRHRKEELDDFMERRRISGYVNFTQPIITRFQVLLENALQDLVYSNVPSSVSLDNLDLSSIILNLLLYGEVGYLLRSNTVLSPRDYYLTSDKGYAEINITPETVGSSLRIDIDLDYQFTNPDEYVYISLDPDYPYIYSLGRRIAWLNWQYYNLDSLITHFIKQHSFSILTYQNPEEGLGGDESEPVVLGNGYILQYEMGTQKPEFIAPDAGILPYMLNRLQGLESTLRYLSGLEAQSDKLTEKHSAVALSLLYNEKFITINQLANKIVTALQAGLRENFIKNGFNSNINITGIKLYDETLLVSPQDKYNQVNEKGVNNDNNKG